MFKWLRSVIIPDKILDAGVKAADALVFTAEEKTAAHKEVYTLWIEAMKVQQAENSIQAMTRRVLAILFCGFFLLYLFAAAIAVSSSPDYAKFLLGLAGKLEWIVGAVVTLYFGPYQIGRVLKKNGK